MTGDVVAAFDPYIYIAGYGLTVLGLCLSQALRESAPTTGQAAPRFLIALRLAAALQIVIGILLGFWILGWWWLAGLAACLILLPFFAGTLSTRYSTDRLGNISMLLGLLMLAWVQGPLIFG